MIAGLNEVTTDTTGTTDHN